MASWEHRYCRESKPGRHYSIGLGNGITRFLGKNPKSRTEVYKVWTEVPKINFLYFSSPWIDIWESFVRGVGGVHSQGEWAARWGAALETSSKQILLKGTAVNGM